MDYAILEKRLCRFFSKHECQDYITQRRNLLIFCLNEDVPPDIMMEFVTEQGKEEYLWAASIDEDIHQAIYMAYKVLMSHQNI